MSSPALDHNLRLLECVEDFTVEQLIAQFAIEALAIAILPRAARLDLSGSGSDGREPLSKGLSHELRTVVGTDVCGNASRDTNSSQSASLFGVNTRRIGILLQRADRNPHAHSPKVVGRR